MWCCCNIYMEHSRLNAKCRCPSVVCERCDVTKTPSCHYNRKFWTAGFVVKYQINKDSRLCLQIFELQDSQQIIGSTKIVFCILEFIWSLFMSTRHLLYFKDCKILWRFCLSNHGFLLSYIFLSSPFYLKLHKPGLDIEQIKTCGIIVQMQ